MKAPAFQCYADDFIGGTVSMTQDEVGAYMRLLCYQWGNGQLPDTQEKLERIAGGPVTPDVLAKFPGGINPRMEAERQKQVAFRAACAEAGKAGGGNPAFQKGKPNPYYEKDKGGDIGQDKGADKGADKGKINSPSPISYLQSPSPIPSPKIHSSAPGFAVPPCFESIDGFAAALAGWIESRKKLRKPATGRAIQLLINRLAERPQQAIRALNEATERGWLTVKWDWLEQKTNGHTTPTPIRGRV